MNNRSTIQLNPVILLYLTMLFKKNLGEFIEYIDVKIHNIDIMVAVTIHDKKHDISFLLDCNKLSILEIKQFVRRYAEYTSNGTRASILKFLNSNSGIHVAEFKGEYC